MAQPETEETIRLAADARATAEATLGGLTPAQLSWNPGGSRWSAAMIADHLVKSTRPMLPLLEAGLASAPEGEQPGGFTWLEKKVIEALGPGGKVKLPVPPMFEPQAPADPVATVKEFLRLHDEIVGIANRSQGRMLGETRITSPASKFIRLRFLPYLQGIIQHERYHLEQVKALIEDPGFPR